MRQFYITAGTSGTTFRADITDDNSVVVRSYDIHQGEINDIKTLPVVGTYTLRVTNASADGNFTCVMMCQE